MARASDLPSLFLETRPTFRGARTVEAYEVAARVRALIVDDEPARATDLKLKLEDPAQPVSRLRLEIDVVEDVVRAREFVARDCVDIYFIDLIMRERTNEGEKSDQVGKNFIKEVIERTNAGIIVNSSLPEDSEADTLLHEGVDDYLEKTYSAKRVSARVISVWRRILLTRPRQTRFPIAHTGRTFQLGTWRFVVGSRLLHNVLTSETMRITPSEQAFLSYICVVEDHTVDSHTLNCIVLKRKESERHIRMDNFIYRLRMRLGENIQLVTLGDAAYRLLNAVELKPSLR